jgi:hypothetical protein
MDAASIQPRFRRVACERGLATNDQVNRMSDAEAMEFIFAPGFSMASKVTDLSGGESAWMPCAPPWSGLAARPPSGA